MSPTRIQASPDTSYPSSGMLQEGDISTRLQAPIDSLLLDDGFQDLRSILQVHPPSRSFLSTLSPAALARYSLLARPIASPVAICGDPPKLVGSALKLSMSTPGVIPESLSVPFLAADQNVFILDGLVEGLKALRTDINLGKFPDKNILSLSSLKDQISDVIKQASTYERDWSRWANIGSVLGREQPGEIFKAMGSSDVFAAWRDLWRNKVLADQRPPLDFIEDPLNGMSLFFDTNLERSLAFFFERDNRFHMCDSYDITLEAALRATSNLLAWYTESRRHVIDRTDSFCEVNKKGKANESVMDDNRLKGHLSAAVAVRNIHLYSSGCLTLSSGQFLPDCMTTVCKVSRRHSLSEDNIQHLMNNVIKMQEVVDYGQSVIARICG